MIDRIRQDIQDRLDQLLSEADRLRSALSALGGDGDGGQASPSPRASRTETASRARSRSASSPRSRSASSSRSRSNNGSSASSRAAAGGTKNAVLKALADARGEAMTATEVAAATGLGRASVSTTLSKLARAGDVTKASRGYQLSDGASSGSGNAGADAVATDA